MSVVEAVELEVAGMGRWSDSVLAATARELAAQLDDPKNSATSKSMCAKALNDTMAVLRSLCPPEEEADRIDEVSRKRELRRRSAGA